MEKKWINWRWIQSSRDHLLSNHFLRHFKLLSFEMIHQPRLKAGISRDYLVWLSLFNKKNIAVRVERITTTTEKKTKKSNKRKKQTENMPPPPLKIKIQKRRTAGGWAGGSAGTLTSLPAQCLPSGGWDSKTKERSGEGGGRGGGGEVQHFPFVFFRSEVTRELGDASFPFRIETSARFSLRFGFCTTTSRPDLQHSLPNRRSDPFEYRIKARSLQIKVNLAELGSRFQCRSVTLLELICI